MPQGGRDAITKNLILREDQLPNKLLYPKTKKKPNKQVKFFKHIFYFTSSKSTIFYAECQSTYHHIQDGEFFSSDDIFSHTADKRAAFQPPLRKAASVFSGRRNPNDNHYSRHKH